MLSFLSDANHLSIQDFRQNSRQNPWGNSSEKQRLPNRVLLYFLPASACTLSFIYFVLFLFVLGYYRGGMFNLIFSVTYLMTFIFYLLNRVTLGKHFLALVFVAQVSLHTIYFFPKESYFQLHFLAALPLVIMLFGSNSKKAQRVYTTLMVSLLAIIQLRSDTRVRPFNFTEKDIDLLLSLNLVSSFLVLSISALVYLQLKKRSQTGSPEVSTTDALIGFNNPHSFYPLAREQFNLNPHNRTPFSILYIAIDHFRQFNQQHGDKAGGEAILQVAALLKKRSRESDILARINDDLFILLLTDSDQQSAALLAQQIVDSVAIAHLAEFNRELSLSIGISEVKINDENIDTTLARAEKALNQAQAAGHNRIAVLSGN